MTPIACPYLILSCFEYVNHPFVLLQMNRAIPASDYIHMVVEEILLKPEIVDCTRPHTKCRYTFCMIKLDELTPIGDLLQRNNTPLISPPSNRVVLPGNDDTSLQWFGYLMAVCPYTREDHIVRTNEIPVGVINLSIYRLYLLTFPFFQGVDLRRPVHSVYELFIGTYPDLESNDLVYQQTALPLQAPESPASDVISLYADEEDVARLDEDVEEAGPPDGERVILDITGIASPSGNGHIGHFGIHRLMTPLDYLPYGDWQPQTRRRQRSDSSSDSTDGEPAQRRRRRSSSSTSSESSSDNSQPSENGDSDSTDDVDNHVVFDAPPDSPDSVEPGTDSEDSGHSSQGFDGDDDMMFDAPPNSPNLVEPGTESEYSDYSSQGFDSSDESIGDHAEIEVPAFAVPPFNAPPNSPNTDETGSDFGNDYSAGEQLDSCGESDVSR